MSKRISSLAVLALLVSLIGLLIPVAAFAAQSGPDSAMALPSGGQMLAVGQRVWYAFQYAGDGSQILVDMSAQPGGSASFAVWTPDDVRNWAQGGGEKPIGRGTDNPFYNDDLVWSGNFNTAGTYYIVVDQTGGAPATINLHVTGSGVAAPAK
jgi:hypothetical protein